MIGCLPDRDTVSGGGAITWILVKIMYEFHHTSDLKIKCSLIGQSLFMPLHLLNKD